MDNYDDLLQCFPRLVEPAPDCQHIYTVMMYLGHGLPDTKQTRYRDRHIRRANIRNFDSFGLFNSLDQASAVASKLLQQYLQMKPHRLLDFIVVRVRFPCILLEGLCNEPWVFSSRFPLLVPDDNERIPYPHQRND